MKNILITGGTGFIGSHTVVELYNAGYNSIIVDDFSNSDKKVLDGIAKITGQKPVWYQEDFANTLALKKILEKHHIDGIIHFAAFKSVGESVQKPLKYYENNVAGFIKLLKEVEDQGIPFVFSSSCTVYGEPDKIPVTEESPTKPAESPYGATKQMNEVILRDVTKISDKLKSISLRYFNPIGAHSSANIGELPIGTPANLLPLITQTVAGLRPALTVYGDDYDTPDGSCIRDYIHVVDLAKAHIRALEYISNQKVGFYDVFNIGSGRGSSVLEVIKAFENVTGKEVTYKIGERRPGDVVAIYADPTKANRILNWKTEKTLEDACLDAWHWQEKIMPADA